MEFKLVEVVDLKTEKDFFEIPKVIYANDKYWVCPLINEVRAVFDVTKNSFIRKGNCSRWVLYDSSKSQAIGRIAAYANNSQNSGQGSIGFFECINNQVAANIMFDAAITWLQQKGLVSALGPVNFGERDRFWGLFVEGEKRPSYQENYNPEYYRHLFENFGWKKEFEQTTYILKRGEFNMERFGNISSRVFSNHAITFSPFDRKKKVEFAQHLSDIYNKAWKERDKEQFAELSHVRVLELINEMLPVIIDKWVWFAFYDNKPAGVFVNIRELNPLLKSLKGSWSLLAKVQVMIKLKTLKPTSCRGVLFGVVPEFQNIGIESGLIMKAYQEIENCQSVKYGELSWIGDFNPRMQSLLNATGAKPGKKHYTYSYIFSSKVE